MRHTLITSAACFGASITSLTALEFGNLELTQHNNSNNNQDSTNPSTTVVVGPGSTTGPTSLQVIGSNRGDIDVSLGAGSDDVATGVLITSVNQIARNNYGDNGGDIVDGRNFANSNLAFYSGLSGGYFIPTANMGGSALSPSGRAEYNSNLSYGYFPYNTYLGAVTGVSENGGPLTNIFGTAGVDLVEEITNPKNGVFDLDLSGLTSHGVAATPENGILLTLHSKNEGNFSMGRDNGDGTFTVSVKDNGSSSSLSYEQDPFAFVYLPTNLAGPNRITALGRVKSDGSSPVSGGTFTVTKRASADGLANVLVSGAFESELNDTEASFISQLPDPGTNSYLLEILSGPDTGTFVEITGVGSDHEITVSAGLTAIADDYIQGDPIEYRIGLAGNEYLLEVPGKTSANSTVLVTPEGGYADAIEHEMVPGAQFEAPLTDNQATYLTTLSDIGSTTYMLEILDGADAGQYEITGVLSDTELTISETLSAVDYPVSYRIFALVETELVAAAQFESELTDADAAFLGSLPDFGSKPHYLEILSGADSGTYEITGVPSDSELTIAETLIESSYPVDFRIFTHDESSVMGAPRFESELNDDEGNFLANLPDIENTTYFLEILSGPDAGTVTEVSAVTSDTEIVVTDSLTALESDYPVEYRIFWREFPNNTDNFAVYEWSAADGGWIVQCRDVPDGFLTKEGATDSEDMFSFVLLTTDPANPLPTVNITNPVAGAQMNPGDSLNLTASATDDSGVASVEFFLNGVSVGVDTTAPFEAPVGPFDEFGTHRVDAAVTDDGGIRLFAHPETFSVVPTLGSGGGLYFNGYDQYVTFGDDPQLKLSTFTLETWFKPEGNFGEAVGTGSGGVSAYPLITKGCAEDDQSNLDMNYFLGIRESDGVLVADFEDALLGINVPVAGVTPVTAGEWHHAAASFDGSTWRLYLNGNLEAILDTGGLVPRADSIQHAALASALNSAGEPNGFFQGYLDEPRIWSIARTQTDIRDTVNFALPSGSDLVGRWALDENSGSTVTSTEGSSISGTLIRDTVWTEGAVFTDNPMPQLSLDQPVDGLRIQLGSTLDLSATATDDGSITQVEFFENGVSIGVDSTAPYETSVTLSSAEARYFVAIATDDEGATSRSAPAVVNVTVPAPSIPGYSVGIIDGQHEDMDTNGYTPPGSGDNTWLVEQSTAAPLAIESLSGNRGDFDFYVNGTRALFADGLMIFTNHPTTNNLASLDNILASAYTGSGEYWLSSMDNENGVSGNPPAREESARTSIGMFPFANGWIGANVDKDGAVRHSSANFPAGANVTVTPSSNGVYTISGLPTIGNLIAVSNQNNEDNITAVGQDGSDWVVTSRDNAGGLQHDGGFGFIYIPVETPQVFSGLIQDDGTLVPLNDNMERVGGIANLGTQGYEVTIGDGSVVNPSNSVMFVVADIDHGQGGDNIYSYFAAGNSFVVFSQDLPQLNSQFQRGGFRFVIVPTDPVVLNGDEVEVFATDGEANEDGDTGQFTFVRQGDVSAELTVPITVSGDAIADQDYDALPSSVTFPAGSSTTTLSVEPLTDDFLELSETVIVTVGIGLDYSLGVFASAIVNIESVVPGVQTVTVSFQEGIDGYTGQFGMRVGENYTAPGVRLKQLGSEVEEYYIDGRPGNNSPDQNGIVRFDNLFGHGPGQIPPGAGIQDAQLIMTTSTAGNAQSGGPYIVDQLVVPVDENTTYDTLQSGQLGGGFEGVRGSVTGYPVAGFGSISNGEVVHANVTQLVQNWSTTAADSSWGLPNHGFAIFTGGSTDGWSYNTVGNENPQLRPKLQVTYTLEGTLRDYFYTADMNSIINNAYPASSTDASQVEFQFMDLNDGTSGTTETLMRFGVTFGDPDDINTIPDGETVVKAELLITTNAPRFGGSSNAQSAGPYAIHQMMVDWDTNSTFGISGPVVPTHIDRAVTRVKGLGWESATFADITPIVQNWRAGAPNYGVNVKPESADGWQPFFLGVADNSGLNLLQPFLRVTTAILNPTDFDNYVADMGAPGTNLADDRDGDRIQAVVEYALGLDPAEHDILPGLVANGSDFSLSFSKGMAASADPRISYAIEVSSDLVNWTEITPDENSNTTISGTIPGPEPGVSKQFGRLRVDYQQ